MKEEEKKYSLVDLSLDELNLLIHGLGELPAKKSHFLINKIGLQASQQEESTTEEKTE